MGRRLTPSLRPPERAVRLGRTLLGVATACALLFVVASSAPAAQVQVQGEIVYDTFTYVNPNPLVGGERCQLSWYVQFTQVAGATSALATLDNPTYGTGLEYPTIGAPPWNTFTRYPTAGVEIVRNAPEGKSWIPLDGYDTPGFGSCATTLAQTQGKWTLTKLVVETENTPPTAAFTSMASANDPLTIEFDGSGSTDDGTIASYAWDFGDTNIGTGAVTPHTFATSGTFPVKLTVTDDGGLSNSVTVDIKVGRGAITIIHATDRDEPGDFTFTGSATLGAFALDTDPGSPEPDRKTFTDLDPATYTVAETLPSGWRLSAIDCGDPTGGTTADIDVATATIRVDAGDAVTCTFKNRQSTGLVVNSTVDSADTHVGDGLCDTGGTISRNGHDEPECTLRAALQEADANLDADTISFDVPGSGPARFTPGLELPELRGPDVIDGETQPQQACTAPSCVVLAPSRGERELYPDQGLYPGYYAREFTFGVIGEGATVRGLTFDRWGAVFVSGRNHRLERNEIHSLLFLEADDSSIVGNLLDANPPPPSGSGFGICQDGAVRVEGNGNRIGGPGPASGNTIRGSGAGLWVFGSDTSIHGNWIDSNALGIAVGDTGHLFSCHPGPPVARRTGIDSNVLSNNGTGIHIESNSEGTVVIGNRIGTDQTGLLWVPNDFGISVRGPAVIGGRRSPSGPCVSPCNLISGNGMGIYVAAFEDVAGVEIFYPVTIRGNTIGPNIDGQPLPVSQVGDGIHVAASSGVAIGGTEPGEGNLIAFNGAGVVLESLAGSPSTRHTIRGNRIFANARLGIDLVAPFGLVGDGVTPNDIGDEDAGGNDLQNFPEWREVRTIDGQVRITGRIPIHSTVQGTYLVDLYLNTRCDPSGHGEGEIPYATLSTTDFGEGFFSLDVPPGVLAGRFLTATATAPNGSTSEFSACLDAEASEAELALTAPAAAGATRLEVAADGLVGKVVAIGEGATRETNYGTAAGSLILARPLRFAHAAGEPVVAMDDTLFVSVDRAVVTRSSRLPDVAALNGRLRAIQGRSVACGEDVTLTLDGSRVAQKVLGSRFTRQSGNRCVFVAKTENGIGRLELDFGKGTWNAQVVRRDLERLTNPVDVGLRIGDDAGVEPLRFRVTGPVWTYAR